MKTLTDILSPTPPPTIYHYTTQQGLLGILESKCLWASRIQHLNDSTEFLLGLERVIEHLRHGRVNDATDQERVEELVEYAQDLGGSSVCVASFSEDGDQLSQWRAYGGVAGGVAIGFDSRKLAARASARFKLIRCIYEQSEQERLISHMINLASAPVNEAGWDPLSPERRIINKVLSIAPIIKHGAFSEEREWRLISEPVRADILSYRSGASMLIPYFPIELADHDGNLPINRIVVGPSPNHVLAYAAVGMLAFKYRVPPLKIAKSVVPLRNW